jgi:hypothetical protein
VKFFTDRGDNRRGRVRICNRVTHNHDGFHINSSEHMHIANCDVACEDGACAHNVRFPVVTPDLRPAMSLIMLPTPRQ